MINNNKIIDLHFKKYIIFSRTSELTPIDRKANIN